MNHERKVSLVAKLLRMTDSGALKWEFEDAGDVARKDDEIWSPLYCTQTDRLIFSICHVRNYRYRKVDMIGAGLTMDLPMREWRTRTILHVKNPESYCTLDTLVDVDDLPILRKLYDSVRRSVTDVDERIDTFLQREATHADR